MIHARGLARTYTTRRGDVEAVRGVDLDVDAGEIVGFLGPNGAGKTTTLRMLTTCCAPRAARQPSPVPTCARTPAPSVGASATSPSPAPRRARHAPARRSSTMRCCTASSARSQPPEAGAVRPAGARWPLGPQVLVPVRRPAPPPRHRDGAHPHPRARCSSTSRPPASTRRPARTSGRTCAGCATSAAAPCSSPRTTSTRPRPVRPHPRHRPRRDRRAGVPRGLKQPGQRRRGAAERDAGRRRHPHRGRRRAAAGRGRATVDGALVEVRVPQGRTLLAGLLRSLDAEGIELDGVELRRPTLDDVFLTLTGRSLRDGESPPISLRGSRS